MAPRRAQTLRAGARRRPSGRQTRKSARRGSSAWRRKALPGPRRPSGATAPQSARSGFAGRLCVATALRRSRARKPASHACCSTRAELKRAAALRSERSSSPCAPRALCAIERHCICAGQALAQGLCVVFFLLPCACFCRRSLPRASIVGIALCSRVRAVMSRCEAHQGYLAPGSWRAGVVRGLFAHHVYLLWPGLEGSKQKASQQPYTPGWLLQRPSLIKCA